MKRFPFDTVILPGFSSGHVPLEAEIAALGPEEAEMREGRLLYVAITRARTNLIVTCTVEPSPLLPMRNNLWSIERR